MENLPEFISNHLFLASLFFALLGMLLWNLFGSAASGIPQVSPQELTRMMNQDNAIVLDVRSEEDFNTGHILNAKNIPEKEIDSKDKEIDKFKDKPVIAYCSMGTVSPKVARLLKTKQIENIYILKGGLQSWTSANLPVTRTSNY
jgi:rhodanese-related sulfurtransferase